MFKMLKLDNENCIMLSGDMKIQEGKILKMKTLECEMENSLDAFNY